MLGLMMLALLPNLQQAAWHQHQQVQAGPCQQRCSTVQACRAAAAAEASWHAELPLSKLWVASYTSCKQRHDKSCPPRQDAAKRAAAVLGRRTCTA